MEPAFKPSVDLNLLTVLDTLLHTRHVTRTAEALHLSQPAVSNALRRLRLYFGDELLVREGNRMTLTPLAQQLSYRTTAALGAALSVFDANATFVPAETRREFSVVMSDATAAIIGPEVCRRMSQESPGARLQSIPISQENFEDLDTTLRHRDGLIIPHGYTPGLPHVDLFEERWVCLVDAANTAVSDPATVDELRRLPRVAQMQASTLYSPADRQLRNLGADPDIDVVLHTFVLAPYFVRGTNRFALVPAHLAPLLPVEGLRVTAAPEELNPVTLAFWWDPTHENDPGHRWFRSLLQDVCADLH